jgi:hypothetical protein
MKRYKLAAFAALFCVAIVSLSGRGQQAPAPPAPQSPPAGAMPDGMAGGFSVMLPPPLTRLEALAAQKGVVVVRGFTDIGTLVTDNTSSVLISAVQFTDGDSREHGIAVHVSQPVEGRTIQTVASVDESEIDALIDAVNKMAKLQDGASPLQQFDARYQTNGALELVSTNVGGGRMILIRAMELRPGVEAPAVAQAEFFVSRLPEIAQRLTTAKELIAKVKSAGNDANAPPQP